jgi:hypothetical protein
MITIYIILGIIILWSLYGYFSSNVESAQYKVIEKKKGYEIRLYSPQILAQTKVKGEYDYALNQGFRILAKYIFGNNVKKESIAMTAPVVEEKNISENIAMTTPVVSNIDGEYHTITFSMPKKYNINNLPKPIDNRIEILSIPEKKMAVKRISFLRTYDVISKNKNIFIQQLKQDNIKTVGEVKYAGYNAPWTPPWMIRNEVMVEII